MENTGHRTARLLTALEELVDQEGMYLRGGYYDVAGETRDRADPLVCELVALSAQPEVADFRPRIDALIARSARHAALLTDKLAELGGAIRRTDQARFRATQLAPAYARAAGVVVPRFQAAG